MVQLLYFFDDCYSVGENDPGWDIVWGQWVRLPLWKRYKITRIWRTT